MGKGHGFELDITMSTSNKPKLAGKMSDMYLVPSLTVLFMKSMVVEFNTKTCKGQAEEKWTWSLKKGEAKNTFSWLSHYELIHTQLVTMNSALSKEKTKLAAERNPIKKKEVKKKVDKLESGLIGWAKVMSQNQKTHDAAKDGSLPKVFAYKKGYYSGLMPENLINKAQKVTGSFTPKEGDAQSSNSFLKGAIGLANKYVGYLPGGAFDKKKSWKSKSKEEKEQEKKDNEKKDTEKKDKEKKEEGKPKEGRIAKAKKAAKDYKDRLTKRPDYEKARKEGRDKKRKDDAAAAKKAKEAKAKADKAAAAKAEADKGKTKEQLQKEKDDAEDEEGKKSTREIKKRKEKN